MPHWGVWVYGEVWDRVAELRRRVPGLNVNRMWNEALLRYISELGGVDEVLRLEAEVDLLIRDLDGVHRKQKAILKHGSYAIAYARELKGLDTRRVVSDMPPYNRRMERPPITEEERKLVEDMVVYRETKAEELRQKVARLMKLKSEGLDPDLMDRVRQSLKVSTIRPAARQPTAEDGLVKLSPGRGRRSPEERYRMRARSGDPVIDRAVLRALEVEEEVKRKREAEDSDGERR